MIEISHVNMIHNTMEMSTIGSIMRFSIPVLFSCELIGKTDEPSELFNIIGNTHVFTTLRDIERGTYEHEIANLRKTVSRQADAIEELSEQIRKVKDALGWVERYDCDEW